MIPLLLGTMQLNTCLLKLFGYTNKLIDLSEYMMWTSYLAEVINPAYLRKLHGCRDESPANN